METQRKVALKLIVSPPQAMNTKLKANIVSWTLLTFLFASFSLQLLQERSSHSQNLVKLEAAKRAPASVSAPEVKK